VAFVSRAGGMQFFYPFSEVTRGPAIDSFALRHDNARALRRAAPHGFQS